MSHIITLVWVPDLHSNNRYATTWGTVQLQKAFKDRPKKDAVMSLSSWSFDEHKRCIRRRLVGIEFVDTKKRKAKYSVAYNKIGLSVRVKKKKREGNKVKISM